MPKGRAKGGAKGGKRGRGFLDVLSGIGSFIKDNKLISTIGSMIPHPAAQRVAGIASMAGLGKKKKGRKGGSKGGSFLNKTQENLLRINDQNLKQQENYLKFLNGGRRTNIKL